MKPNTDSIFGIDSQAAFNDLALAVFRYQSAENEVYRQYLNGLGISAENVKVPEEIPFLPISFFKSHNVVSGNAADLSDKIIFTSSGTTGTIQSKHIVTDISLYKKSYTKAFELFYGKVKDLCILALLPSYLEREGSSLIYMMDDLIKQSAHRDSRFYLNDTALLIEKLHQLENQQRSTLLIGVTYALLDLIEQQQFRLKHTIIMETGGMKGKRKEMVREELHEILCKGFGVEKIHSEYGMTELLSQAYSKGDGIFACPPWMKIMIRDVNDPLSFIGNNKSGGINVIDLANINSCSFIATQDLGKTFDDGNFEVLGRFDNSDIRGCNLLVQ